MFYKVFTDPTCFPLPIRINGTFTSNGVNVTTYNLDSRLVGSSLLVGDYLYSTSLNEIRKITGFNSDLVVIESAFSSDIVVQEAIKVTDRSVVYISVSVTNIDDVDAEFDGELFSGKTVQNIEDTDGIFFTIDATSTHISILAI